MVDISNIKLENLKAFINFGYIPFSKKQCILRIILLWMFSTIPCILSKQVVYWAIAFAFINILVSIALVTVVVKHSKQKVSRFLCDGIFNLYLSVLLNVSAYRIFYIENGENLWMLFLFLLLMFLVIFAIWMSTIKNIRNDVYGVKRKESIHAPIIVGGGVLGISFAKYYFETNPESAGYIFLAIMLLLISFLTCLGSLGLLRAFIVSKCPDII